MISSANLQRRLCSPAGSARQSCQYRLIPAARLAAILILGLATLLAWSGRPVAASGTAQTFSSTHTVRYGETLSEIAQTYGVSMADLMALNHIEDSDAIYVGQVLRLPALQAPQPTPAATPAGQPQGTRLVTTLNRTYTVVAGDTVGWIALRFGVDLDALKAINGLDGPDAGYISAGQELILPATAQELQVEQPSRYYTVQPGDSLSRIAEEQGISLESLMAANNITNPNVIREGQTLTIPGNRVTTAAPPVGPPQRGFFYYRVQPGDTLSALSQIFESTPQAIVRYNNLPDETTVYTGLEIRIPFGPPPFTDSRPPSRLTGTRFVISISRQRCWVIQGEKVIYDWKCSTGQGQWVTRTGTFPVQTKMEMAGSSAYRLDMPYWLGLYDVGDFENGIHGIPIRWDNGEKLWRELVGHPATFGCAMLLDEDAARLYELAYVGMPVHIVD